MSIAAGIELGRERLRQRGTWLALGLGLSFELGVALLERAHGALGATDRALLGGAFGVALPLVCYFLVGQACGSGSLRDALWPLARHGFDRRPLTVGLALPAAALAAAFGGLGGALVVLFTRGSGDPRFLGDVWASFWIGTVSGAAYVAAFIGASAFGRSGRGRAWLLAADFLLGAGDSFLAFPWPKGHVRNLLGGTAVLELPQMGALLALLGTSFAFLWLGSLRNQR
jgi:hypothetical protein